MNHGKSKQERRAAGAEEHGTLGGAGDSARPATDGGSILNEMVDERDLAYVVSGEFAGEADRVARSLGLKVEETFEVSELYGPQMGTVVFRVEGRKRAVGENGEFEGLVVRVALQESHDDIPASVFRRVDVGTQLLIPVGNIRDGVVDYGRFQALADAPPGSMWLIKAPKYLHQKFEKIPTKGGREFYPYLYARLGSR